MNQTQQYKFGVNQRPGSYLPPGNYRVRIRDARRGISANGNELIRLDLWQPEQGVLIRDQLVLIDKCFWKLDEFCLCFDLGLSKGASITPDQAFADSLVGRLGFVRLKDDCPNGIKVSKVDAYLPAKATETVAAYE